MNGKVLYTPSGKAREYSEFACNFYIGCSNQCEYCFLKKGITKKVLGGSTPQLKKGLTEDSAIKIFEKEVNSNLKELQRAGILMSFTTDPMLNETIDLTLYALKIANNLDIPFKILTKTGIASYSIIENFCYKNKLNKDIISIGWTLTGHDDLEPYASDHRHRIRALYSAHMYGFKTFISFEPIIDFESTFKYVQLELPYVDLMKFGLLAGGKFVKSDLLNFMGKINVVIGNSNSKVFFKDSIIKLSGIDRSELNDHYVDMNYNIFGR